MLELRGSLSLHPSPAPRVQMGRLRPTEGQGHHQVRGRTGLECAPYSQPGAFSVHSASPPLLSMTRRRDTVHSSLLHPSFCFHRVTEEFLDSQMYAKPCPLIVKTEFMFCLVMFLPLICLVSVGLGLDTQDLGFLPALLVRPTSALPWAMMILPLLCQGPNRCRSLLCSETFRGSLSPPGQSPIA